MASNPAASNDLVDRSLRTLSTLELQVGQNLLADAWNIIITEVPTIPARVDADTDRSVFIPLVVQVQCAMVLRVLNNPDGKLSETLDDYTYRLDTAVSTGALYLSDVERDLLGRGDDASDNAFSIRNIAVPYRALPVQWEFLP